MQAKVRALNTRVDAALPRRAHVECAPPTARKPMSEVVGSSPGPAGPWMDTAPTRRETRSDCCCK